MKLSSLKKPEFWERHLSMAKKQFRGIFRDNCSTRPVFVLGNQRSGTTMLMDVFHRHPDMLVYDEHRDSPAFSNCRIRSADTIRSLLEQARFPAISLKPICDSHRFGELYREFPDGHFIWLYRDFKDVANSSLRKFDAPTRAVRLVCTNRPGGGWFQDGVSPRTQALLQQVYRPDLTEFDLACLAWGARNQLAIENGLAGRPGVTVLQYEALVSSPFLLLEWLFRRIDVRYLEQVQRNVTARSIGRHAAPAMDARVRDFCDSTLAELDRAFFEQHPPGARV
jgi:hypothetical protein